MKMWLVFFGKLENEEEEEEEEEVLTGRVAKIPAKIVKIIYDCTDCSREFSSRTAFEEHECSTKRVDNDNRCDICLEKYVLNDSYLFFDFNYRVFHIETSF